MKKLSHILGKMLHLLKDLNIKNAFVVYVRLIFVPILDVLYL